ncbi:response regulator transcription factor [Bacteroidota bacterium]
MDYSKFKILLVDDEPDVIEFLGYNLKKHGFVVHSAKNGREAIKKVRDIIPHLILLDVMMPEMDGIETCEEIRKIPGCNKILIAFLTARGEDYSQIAGFEAGADDYITKPIKPKVLISRIKALLKRYSDTADDIDDKANIIIVGDFEIDQEKHQIKYKNKILELPKKEYELLFLLASKPEKMFSREEIFVKIWGDNNYIGDRTIDVHIRKIREKIGRDKIITIKGVGYRLLTND